MTRMADFIEKKRRYDQLDDAIRTVRSAIYKIRDIYPNEIGMENKLLEVNSVLIWDKEHIEF